MSGYYTRFGDVRELLAQVDDRYIIMNAGDEMTLRFAEQPAPPAGWTRDLRDCRRRLDQGRRLQFDVFEDGAPLPYHAKQEYLTAPGRLEDE